MYSVITWWRIVRDQDLGGPAVHGGTAGQPDGEGVDAGAAAPADRATETTRREEDELAAYDRYLASLRDADRKGRP